MSAAIRPARDGDGAALASLISGCWKEYPGCDVPVEEEIPDISRLASSYAAKGGALWVSEADGAMIGVIGVKPHEGAYEISKMYVAAAARGGGLAQALLGLAEGFARAHDAEQAVLWSDTRFNRAHRFYEKQGYVRHGAIRVLHDLADSLEYGYAKPLAGIAAMRLDAAAAASAVPVLAAVLAECVDAGASLGFRAPLARPKAIKAIEALAADVAKGASRLIGGWIEGRLAGCVALRWDGRETEPHLATLSKLIVVPWGRGQGLGAKLIAEAEAAARQEGRSLIYLFASDDGAAPSLYRRLGYSLSGRIPGGGGLPDGRLVDALIFHKSLKE